MTSARQTSRASRMGYQPGLDGIRAVSVIAVLLYHAGITWLPGGFLGVEVFFVVSGYLITSLLLQEREQIGYTDLRHFWLRRARRLLPALYVMLAATVVYASLFVDDALSHLKGDVIAALTYVTNWWLIFSNQSYFDQLGRPPLLRHLWSLAVEEQWYLLWPLVFAGGMALAGNRPRRLLGPVLAAAAASTLLMAILYVPDTDPSRVYYGTDTRASGLLLGAALALVWSPWKRSATRFAPGLEVIGVVGLVALGVFFATAGQFDPFLYRGGFLLVSLASCAAIAVSVSPQSHGVRRALGIAPLVWIGVRSYGLYLWHWPVYQVTRKEDLGFGGPAQLLLRLVLTVVLTELTFRFVETPVRGGAIGRFLARLKAMSPEARAAALRPVQLAAVAVALIVGVAGVRVATAPKVEIFIGGKDDGAALGSGLGGVPASSTPDTSAARPSSTSAASGSTAAPGTPATTAPTTATTPATLPRRVVVVGDSMAHALVANASKSLQPQLTISNGAVEGCGLIDRGAIRTRADYRRTFDFCQGFAAKWQHSVEVSEAQVALVVIGAWDVFDFAVDGTTLKFGTPEHDAFLKDRLAAGISALRAGGAQVALMQVPCFRPIAAGGLKALPERGEDDRTRHLSTLLKEAAAADPAHVFYVDGLDAFCQAPLDRDVGARWDGVHYYRPGAKVVFDALTPQLLSIPVG